MSHGAYTIGIDLGTSHSVLSYWKAGMDGIEILEIEQVQSPGHKIKSKTLPSVTYLPHEGELSSDQVCLSWQSEGDASAVIGHWAKERSTQVADRVISSAKSCLCHHHMDRLEAILPWQSSVEGKQSPVTAIEHYLRYLRHAFAQSMKEQGEELDFDASDVTITVPASFDDIARNFTYEAAVKSGFKNITLIEEPQAAFYSWIAKNEQEWRKQVQAGDLILVCDIGGGTTDFSMIAVSDRDGQLELERVSVGDHLLLGGDNMDLALAHYLKQKLKKEGVNLDRWQFVSLISATRAAKEKLLSEDTHEEVSIAVASKGSSLFAKSVTVSLSRQEVENLLLEGFLPLVAVDEVPAKKVASGLQEFGLPYEREAAISKHLAQFLKQSRKNLDASKQLSDFAQQLVASRDYQETDYILPTAVLFNGGVLNSETLKKRIFELVNSWSEAPIRELSGIHLDLAVSHGATYFSKEKKEGDGIRIGSGTARSYYLGIESSGMAIPGIEPEIKGLCLVPQGTEEGVEVALPQRQFGLVTGQASEFRFFSSLVRSGDQTGTVVDVEDDDVSETAGVGITLPSLSENREGEVVPVFMNALVTEVGTLQLYMKHAHSDKKWKVEFNIRPQH